MNPDSKQNKISWKRILLFLIIAISVSNIFRFDIFAFRESLKQLPVWLFLLTTALLEGSGVIIGAFVAIKLLKKERKTEMSLFGTSRSNSLLMAVVPLIILTVVGVTNDQGLNSHAFGFFSIIASFLYCIMEEYGWRGYLQEELKGIKPWGKYLAIGFIWYFWHLSFLTKASAGDNLFFLGMMVLGSWGIGQVAESTKSIIACACFHLLIQIMLFNALIKNGISGSEKLIILGISISIWYIVIKKWEKESKTIAA